MTLQELEKKLTRNSTILIVLQVLQDNWDDILERVEANAGKGNYVEEEATRFLQATFGAISNLFKE